MKDKMRVAIGADHGGYELKDALREWLLGHGYDVIDVGTFEEGASVDYPDYARLVAEAVTAGAVDAADEADRGVLVCGTGLGMAIAANKVPGARAVPVGSVEFARLSREHNDANVLCLSGRFVDPETNKQILETFLTTDFEGGRHAGRVEKITRIERGE